nr:hypothetical protein [Mannheimia haemolytica]
MTPLHYAMRAKNVDAAIALLNAGQIRIFQIKII